MIPPELLGAIDAGAGVVALFLLSGIYARLGDLEQRQAVDTDRYKRTDARLRILETKQGEHHAS